MDAQHCNSLGFAGLLDPLLHNTIRHSSRGARIEDFGRGDFVKVDCAVCHQVALLTPKALLRVGLSSAAKVLDLNVRLRCRGCGRKGRAVVSIRWRGQGGETGGHR